MATQSNTSVTTKTITIPDRDNFDNTLLADAVDLLQKGEVVAFPTETVYGLGANALSADAVNKIFLSKGRPSDNPLIVHISSMDMLKKLVAEDAFPTPGSLADTLCKRYWPGPLTLLFKKSDKVANNVTAGQPYVAVRMPSHPIARKMIELADLPIAAPSANVSGRPSPTQASHVLQDLNGIIHCVIDGGSTDVGLESTVVDLNREPPLILRPGGVTLEQLREVIPTIQVYEKHVHGTQLEQKPPTPGLKYRHYSPTAKVVLFEDDGNLDSMQKRVETKLKEEWNKNHTIGIIHTHPKLSYHIPDELQSKTVFHNLGDDQQPDLVAKGIFGALRELDSQGVNIIFIEGISEKNEGMAVMNRVRKAASETF